MTNFLKHLLLVTIFLLPLQQLQATGDTQTIVIKEAASWTTRIFIGLAVTGGAYYCSNYIGNFFKMPARVDNIKKDTGQIIQSTKTLQENMDLYAKNQFNDATSKHKIMTELICQRTYLVNTHTTTQAKETRQIVNEHTTAATQAVQKILGDQISMTTASVDELQKKVDVMANLLQQHLAAPASSSISTQYKP